MNIQRTSPRPTLEGAMSAKPADLTREEIIAAFSVSDSYSVDPDLIQRTGAVRPTSACPVKCSVDVGARYAEKRTNVFAIINHPGVGHVAVSPSEFEAFGLPEVKNWEWLKK